MPLLTAQVASYIGQCSAMIRGQLARAADVNAAVQVLLNDAKNVRDALLSHVASVSNPHSTTATQVGAIPTTGGVTLTGNLTVASAVTIDGRDLSADATVNAATKVTADAALVAAAAAQATANAAQVHDATLDALSGLNSTAGLVEQTGVDAFTKRAIGVATSTDIPTRANGDTRWILQTEKAAALGVATLDAGVKTVQNPASAQTTAAASKIPISGSDSTLAAGFYATGTASEGYIPRVQADGSRAWVALPSIPTSFPVITLSGITTSGTIYETNTEYGVTVLRLARDKTFATTVANIISSVPAGWTWRNSGSLSAASEDSTNGRKFTFGATNSDWFGATRNAPLLFKTMNRERNAKHWVMARVASDGDSNFEGMGLMIYNSITDSNYVDMLVGNASSPGVCISSRIGDSSDTTVSITAAQRNAGIWLFITIDANGVANTYYNTVNQSTPPTTGWMVIKSATCFNDQVASVNVATWGRTTNTGATLVGKVLYYDDNFPILEPGLPYAVNPRFGAQGFSTAGTAILLYDDFPLNGRTLDQAALRQILADSVNLRIGDAAPVTWHISQSDSAAVAAGTFYDATALVLASSGTTPYEKARVWARITATSNSQQGSIKLPLILPCY